MNLHLRGKIALVTGSSRGIGRAIAEALHEEGCRVVLNGRDRQSLADAASGIPGAHAIEGDMTSPDDAQRVVREVVSMFGGLDVLVCNVGSGWSVAPGEESLAEWQRVFAVNLWSATNSVEAAREALSTHRGVIVCVSSICGLEVIPGAPVTYSAAKAALNAYVRGISRPLGKAGIRINAVAPGNIIFKDSVWSRKLLESPKAVEAMLADDVALSRLGRAEEVAELVCYLCSDRSGFSTGSVHVLDGGQVRS